ncbi:MAG: flagellar basal body P-ring formation chaperone FlgA [Verrucomicrobiota bacterium]
MKLLTAILVPCAAVASIQASEMGDILTPLAYAPTNSPAAAFSDHPAPAQTAPPAVVTSVGDVQVGADAVLEELRLELTARLSLRGNLKVSFVKPWQPVEVRNGHEWKLVLEGVPKEGLSSTSPIRFSLEAGGKKLGTWQTEIRAELFEPVWVATRRLDRGEPINSSVAALKDFDVLAGKRDLLTSQTDLGFYETAQTISADQPITRRDVSLRRLVRRGREVDVMVNQGALNISMKGIALNDGGAGELVTVRNKDSKKDFQAQVVGDNAVQVKF